MTKLADFYIKYKHDFAPYDWENRQSHLAALFTSDDGIIFGEGEPSEEQQEQGIPYAKIFNHRVYHLESNPNIIVMQFANSIDIPVEIHYENSLAKNEPSCLSSTIVRGCAPWPFRTAARLFRLRREWQIL